LKTPKKQRFFFPFAIIYLGGLLTFLMILAFPGAKIFYKSIPVENELIEYDDPFYHIAVPVDTRFYNVDSLLLLENGLVMQRIYTDDPRYQQVGTFLIHEVQDGRVPISFIPSLNLKGNTSNQNYQVLIRLNILSGNNVGRIVVILIAWILIYLGFANKNIFSSQNLSRFIKGVTSKRLPKFQQDQGTGNRSLPWRELAIRSSVELILLTYFFVFMEWIFFITKSSFLDSYSFWGKIRIFLIAAALATSIALLFLSFLLLLGKLISNIKPGVELFFAAFPFAFLSTCMVCLLLDNFFTTIFSIGIAGTSALVRILLLIGFLIILIHLLIRVADRYTQENYSSLHRFWRWLALGFLVISITLAFSQISTKDGNNYTLPKSYSRNPKPNIILISSDGLDASHMSVYGYELDTTPFLRELAASSLVSENNFPNTDHTWGSETSVLTGRYPFVTRVLFSPDILRGNDQFLHLPGILKSNGYKTYSLSVPYYNDANDIDFLNAFDVVNCSEKGINFTQWNWYGRYFEQERYLLYLINKRVIDRLSHIFFIKNLYKPFYIVNDFTGRSDSDRTRLTCLRKYLSEAKETGQPVFVQIHQMGTHGPTFGSILHRFSNDLKQDRVWMPEFYDDSIINFDSDMATLVEYLKSLGIYQNTILIVYTDHGTEWSSSNRLPLIFHFPNDQGKGKILENTQNIDIAPTILDYLGVEIPPWMDGFSLLSPIPNERTVFSVDSIEPIQISGLWTMPNYTLNKPFQQLESIKAIQCQNITSIDLENFTIEESEVEEHTSPCSEDSLNTRGEIINKMAELLTRAGFQLPKDWINLK
jgi:arylsulfatase A-like enzyme